MKLRIVHVIESLQPRAGSLALALPGLIDYLERQDVENDVIALDLAAAYGCAAIESAVQRASVVHVHGWNPEGLRNAAAFARNNRRAYIVSPCGDATVGRIRKRTWGCRMKDLLGGDRVLKGAALVTAINEFERTQLADERVHARVELLPYGLSVAERALGRAAESVNRDNQLSDRKNLLFLGPLDPRTGLVALLKAAAELRLDDEGWRLVVAGPTVGDWRAMLEAAVHRQGAGDRVEFVTDPDESKQRELLSQASLLVSPSLHPQPPVSVMLAVAMRVPVIATEPASVPGLNGFVQVCAPTREGIRSALQRFASGLREPSSADRSAEHTEAIQAINWSTRGERFLRLYRELGSATVRDGALASARKSVGG